LSTAELWHSVDDQPNFGTHLAQLEDDDDDDDDDDRRSTIDGSAAPFRCPFTRYLVEETSAAGHVRVGGVRGGRLVAEVARHCQERCAEVRL
jgi:hypothetical protein